MADARHYNYTRVMIRAYVPIRKRARENCSYHSSSLIGLYLYNGRAYHTVAWLKISHLSAFFFLCIPPFPSPFHHPFLFFPREISRHTDASRLQSSADIFHFARSPSDQPFTGRFKVLLIPDFTRPTDPGSDQSLIRDRSRNALRMFIREAGDEREKERERGRGDTLVQFPMTRWHESRVSHIYIYIIFISAYV